MEDLRFKEKRAFARYPVRILLKYEKLNLLEEAHAETRDISAKGICIITSEELAVETPLDLWLRMPDNGEQVHIKGKVVWSSMLQPDKYRVGINLENTELNPIILALKAIKVRIRHH